MQSSSSSGGNGGAGSLDILDQDLNAILEFLQNIFGAGQANTNTDLITFTTHDVPQPLYTSSKKVKWALIQNISSTDIITLVAISNLGGKTPTGVVNYQGTILNPAGTSNQGGGSYPTFNVDLSNIAVICDTTDGLVGLSVTYGY